jgi:light-regulated signal transduction histidine kinase (bacteriophytochrome)
MQSQNFLIIDDDPAEREIMAHTIRDAYPAAKVRQASDPNEAEGACGEQDFDCVIVDYNMPQMDGLTLSQKLRPRFPHLPVVLVTSVGDEMLAAQALRSGVSDYIPKARINTDSIHRTIARAMHVSAQSRVIEEQRNELENFAYALAHDFKQPIRQIRTFTKLISGELDSNENDEVVQHLNYLSDAARRLGNLVDVMSQYTLLSKAPEIGVVDLKKVIDEVKASLSSYVEERHGQLVVRDLPTVKGNETLMIQVLQNLIINGLKYNKSSSPRVEVSGYVQNGRCILSVRDNGIGMEEKYLTEIFKPLMRLHPAAEYPGSGLGLTLARKAISGQNGKIWCESKPEQGSTFYLELQVPENATTERSIAVN